MEEILKNYTILFADDEKEIRDNFTFFLETFFKKVYVACDGEEAYSLYEKFNPDAIILDINMPILDGLETAKKIREIDIKTPIVMLTAHTDKDRLLRAIELNLLKYIVKPINRKESKELLEVLAKRIPQEKKHLIFLDNNLIWNDDEDVLLDENKNEIKLRAKEKEFLKILIKNKNKNVSFDEIFCYIWQDEIPEYNMSNRIKTIAKDLRKKLPEDTIKSIYGFGFKI